MDCKTITEKLKRVAAIVDSWKAEDGVPQIERDIALGELRDIYNALLVVSVDDVEQEEKVADVECEEQEIEVEVVVENVAEEESAAAADVASIESFYDALDIDALLGLTEESAATEEVKAEPMVEIQEEVAPAVEEQSAEPVAEAVVEPEPEVVVEPVAESKSEPVEPAPEPAPVAEEPKPIGVGLFDLDDIPVRTKSRRKMISLYSDDPIPAHAPIEPVKHEAKVVESAPSKVEEPKVEKEPKREEESVVEPVSAMPQQRLGDTFSGVKTLADQMAKNDDPTTPFNRITELRQAIGLNDKFLMIRDLFGGDAARYEATIDTLDEFDDLDECIIYIVENFRWNPDLEAAKLLVSLIERKLA